MRRNECDMDILKEMNVATFVVFFVFFFLFAVLVEAAFQTRA